MNDIKKTVILGIGNKPRNDVLAGDLTLWNMSTKDVTGFYSSMRGLSMAAKELHERAAVIMLEQTEEDFNEDLEVIIKSHEHIINDLADMINAIKDHWKNDKEDIIKNHVTVSGQI